MDEDEENASNMQAYTCIAINAIGSSIPCFLQTNQLNGELFHHMHANGQHSGLVTTGGLCVCGPSNCPLIPVLLLLPVVAHNEANDVSPRNTHTASSPPLILAIAIRAVIPLLSGLPLYSLSFLPRLTSCFAGPSLIVLPLYTFTAPSGWNLLRDENLIILAAAAGLMVFIIASSVTAFICVVVRRKLKGLGVDVANYESDRPVNLYSRDVVNHKLKSDNNMSKENNKIAILDQDSRSK